MWGTGGLAELSWVSEPLPHAKSPLRFRLGASYPEHKPLDQDFFHLDRLQTFFFWANQERNSMLTRLIVVIILQYIQITNHYVVHLKVI